MTEISLVVNNLQHVTGLSRYASNLYQGLQESERLTTSLTPLGRQPVPTPMQALGQRVGIDIGAFLKTYPIAWPANLGDIVHLTHRSYSTLLFRKGARRVVVTVHDIIHYQHRDDPDMHIYLHKFQAQCDAWSIKVLRRADVVLASSAYTRQALIDTVGLDPERVVTIHLGVDSEHFKPQPVPDRFYEQYALRRDFDYLLHISSEEPRKNIPAILQAFAAIHSDYPQAHFLKIGRPMYPEARQQLQAQIEALGLQGCVTFIDHVSDADLPLFYNAARLLVFPSKAEGFGFPVLEAMASGTPVICSNATSLPELAGDAAILVDPQAPAEIAEAIRRLLEDSAYLQQLRERGLTQARGFTWEKTAQKTLAVYERMMRNA